ncbi:Aste57867_22276 [Aphanomyces stellatus]|uniref:Aste57867_22276 protein n=1 Tax=Aphanomyces stellatus TaxID=120398 RepID=A0A485LPM4_9STRA|nr:hypothetical protein As57867_022206 [Aphanomyces stellatus]VFT98942.1 Aste57867_22276 [Aphanomyces stellatus]
MNFAEHRKEVIKMAHDNLKKAQRRQKDYYDKRRSNVTFKQGDIVLLVTRNLPLKHAQQFDKSERPKLEPRFIGPFEIVQVINDNVMRLKLPRSMSRLHDVFNVDRLKATPVILDEDTGEELFIVEMLLKKRQFNRKLEYLVKWHGQPDSEATWELMKNIKHVAHFKQLVYDSERRRSQP